MNHAAADSGPHTRPGTQPDTRPGGRPDGELVRREVEALLLRAPAFRALDAAGQRRLAGDMAKVGAFLADKGWIESRPPAPARLGEAQAEDAVDDLKKRLAGKQALVGSEFEAGAVKQGVEQFGQLVEKVDFPRFVGGLVQGVFQAVVDASIQQMQAYGELLAATAKTVDQFAQDHITDAQARDHIANRYPGAARIDTSGPTARLRPAEGDSNVDLGRAFNVKDAVDLSDDDSEQALVTAAKLEMARMRQQQLATMVLLGINRIVVTNGHINAKVVFDMRASDTAKRHARAEMHDRSSSTFAMAAAAGFGFFGAATGYTSSHETTVSSAVDDTSEAKASVKAQLSGDVKINFKSETFPLERMVDVLGMNQLQEKAQPGAAAPAAAAPGAAAPAPAPRPPATGGAR